MDESNPKTLEEPPNKSKVAGCGGGCGGGTLSKISTGCDEGLVRLGAVSIESKRENAVDVWL